MLFNNDSQRHTNVREHSVFPKNDNQVNSNKAIAQSSNNAWQNSFILFKRNPLKRSPWSRSFLRHTIHQKKILVLLIKVMIMLKLFILNTKGSFEKCFMHDWKTVCLSQFHVTVVNQHIAESFSQEVIRRNPRRKRKKNRFITLAATAHINPNQIFNLSTF